MKDRRLNRGQLAWYQMMLGRDLSGYYSCTELNYLPFQSSDNSHMTFIKVARYSFSGSIPPKFEHKLRHQKQSFGKIATTVVLDKDENLFWSGLQRHRSCHSNEMTLLPILLIILVTLIITNLHLHCIPEDHGINLSVILVFICNFSDCCFYQINIFTVW